MWLCLQSAPYKSDLWTLFNAQRGISQLLGDKSKYKNSNEQMTLWFALTLPPLTSPHNTMYRYVPNVAHIVDRKWVWTENAPSYILLVCQRCGRGRETKLAANRKVKSRRQVAAKSFSSSSKLEQPLFLFCLSFWFSEDETEQKQQTGLKQQVNVINKAILRPSRPRMQSSCQD